MSKFGDDIRRISRYQELLDMIRQQEGAVTQVDKAAIDGARAIVYGQYNTAKKGTPGVTTPDNNTATTDEDKEKDEGKEEGKDKITLDDPTSITEAATSEALSSLDNSDRDGWYDLTSLLNGAKDGLGKSPPTDSDLINSITGVATAAGRAVVLHLRGAERSFVGSGNAANGSSVWDAAPDPDWQQGYYYTANNFAGTAQGETFNRAGKAVADMMLGYNIPAIPGSTITRVDYVSSTINPSTGNGDYTVEYYYTVGSTVTGPITNNIGVTRGTCLGVDNPSPYCVLSAPGVTWEDLGATQLAWVNSISTLLAPIAKEYIGRFTPHPQDVNVPSNFKLGVSILDLKTTGGSNVRLGPLADGGWYAHYSDGSGNPTGDANAATVFKINNDRTFGGYITPTQLSKLKPAE